MAARLRNKKERLAQGAAKERLLAAAETLFAEAGVDGVSFRDLAGVAGVSLSAAHYYFDSKQAILANVFAKRAKVMTERRAELLDRALAGRRDQPDLAEVLRAFVQPAFELTHGDRNDVFNHLLARLAVERSEANRAIISTAFLDSDLSFIDAIAKAAPQLSFESIQWRFHFLVGAMIYTMSDSGHLRTLSQNLCSPADTEKALRALVESFTAVFSAPTTSFSSSADVLTMGAALQGDELTEGAAAPLR